MIELKLTTEEQLQIDKIVRLANERVKIVGDGVKEAEAFTQAFNIAEVSVGLGHEVHDEITGFSGYVTQITQYLAGSTRAEVQPICNIGGKQDYMPKAEWFEIDRLERV